MPLNEAQAKILELEAELRNYSWLPASDALENLIGISGQNLAASDYYATAPLSSLGMISFL